MKTKNIIIAGLAGLLLAACTENLVEKKPSMPSYSPLKIEVSDNLATTRADYSGFPSTTFETGDAIGIYAFDGSSYVTSNIRFVKQSDGSWLPDEEVPYVEDYTYYAYFPYRATTYTPSTSGAVDAVDTKFGAFISDASNYFWQADQSTKAGYTYCNLMIAKGSVTDVNDETATIKFTMKHKRALSIVEGVSNRWYYSDIPSESYAPTVTIDGLYKIDDSFYYLVKPNTPTVVLGNTINIDMGTYKNLHKITLDGTPEYNYYSSSNGETYVMQNNKPGWLTIVPGENIEIQRAFQTNGTYLGSGSLRINVPADNVLKNRSAVSNVDLSMVDNEGNERASRTTANCYLVHAPGTYKIPLVYGNAIKNGVANTRSMYTTDTNSNLLRRLVNHKDEANWYPWITSSGDGVCGGAGFSVNGAKLVWQDVKNMITNVGIDGYFLTFTVDEDNIAEGNAVVAATVSGTVVWSWHIWVTTQTLTNLTTIDTGSKTYQLAPVYLGQVTGEQVADASIYEPAYCRIKMIYDNVTLEFPIRGRAYYNGGTYVYAAAPYYNWGRKDPFSSIIGMFDENGTWGYNTLTYGNSSTIGLGIKNPDKRYYCSGGIYKTDHNKTNLWNIDDAYGNYSNTNPIIKTIYDPCPPGFTVAPYHLTRAMGNNNSRRDDTNWDSTKRLKIWRQSTFPEITTGDDLYFYNMGTFGTSSSPGININTLYFWSAANSGNDNGHIFRADNEGWDGYGVLKKYNGIPVLPVAEE